MVIGNGKIKERESKFLYDTVKKQRRDIEKERKIQKKSRITEKEIQIK